MTIESDLQAILDSPAKPTIDIVSPLIRDYYAIPGTGCGGSLHIVLEDGNIEQRSLEYCQRWAIQNADKPGELLAKILLRMSRTQRHRLYQTSHYPVGVV